ncbi:hypothetical protein D3C80_1763490 [compost metagenome]
MAGGAAINRHDQGRAIGGKLLHRRRVRPITLENTIWNIDFRRQPEMCEKPIHQRGRRGAINVIIAEDRHLLAGLDGADQPFGSLFAICQHMRVGHQ